MGNVKNMMVNSDIRNKRKSLGWSQCDLGSYLGVSQKTISRWERRGLPKIGASRALLEGFLKIKNKSLDLSS